MRGLGQINSRKLQRRIEVINLTATDDGFGGKTITENSLGYYWADWRSINSNSRIITNLNELGIKDFSQLFKVTLRANVLVENVEQTRIKYLDRVYDIVTIQEIDVRNIKISLIVKEHRSGS